jgi:peptidylprolyl isomerase
MIRSLIIITFLLLNVYGAKNAVFETTAGNIELELREDLAPLTVENFENLIKSGYYNGVIFHRVIKNFMIQSGDPTGTGRGGESSFGKPFKDEFHPKAQFNRPGVLAMANRGSNTNGSQFFITTVETRWLNGKHTIFGYVKDKGSYEIVKKIENTPTGYGDKPIEEQKIIKAYMK